MAEEIKSRIEKLRDKVYGIRTVRMGDFVFAEDHNIVVECMKELVDILEAIPIVKVEVRLVKAMLLAEKFYGEFMWGVG